MRAVGTKVPEDVYERLKERAKELGYPSVSSLLRDLIYRFLGVESEGVKVNRVIIDYNLDELVREVKQLRRELEDLRRRVERMEGLNRWLQTGSTRPRKR